MNILSYLKYRWLRKYKSLQGGRLKKNAVDLVNRSWQADKRSPDMHQLPAPLMINLTSFPKRYNSLHLTIKSLLLQDIRPDRVNLWLYQADINQLPENVKQLETQGLTIIPVAEDSRSYKKLIPALNEFPDAFHVTADDDIYYRPDWLSTLVSGFSGNYNEILCWRAHYLITDSNGDPKPYRKWHPKTEVRGPDPRLFFTSGAGVLFPPGSLPPIAKDLTLALKLAPYADDLWWYSMARLNNCLITRVGNNPALINWPDSRDGSLWQFNKQTENGNDAQLKALISYFQFNL
ncbi:MAG: glycosyltransferase family 2 protein [Pseudomonadota bacterium]